MKVSEVRKYFAEQSAKASDVSRQLSLAGVAIVWLLRDMGGPGGSLGRWLLLASLTSFGVALLADLGQYWLATYLWGRQVASLKQSPPDDDYKVPAYVNRIPRHFYRFKAPGVVSGYVFVVVFMGLVLGWGTFAPISKDSKCSCQCLGITSPPASSSAH